MSPEIQSRVLDRLAATDKADEPWALIILAAMEGTRALDAFLDTKTSVTPPRKGGVESAAPAEPPGTYVNSITVEGFRGRRRLDRQHFH